MNGFLSAAQSASGKFIKQGQRFANPGDSVTLEVRGHTSRPKMIFGTSEPEVDKNGNQIMEEMIEGLDYDAESEEEAQVVLAVSKFAQKRAIGKALMDAGVSSLEPGGILKLTYTGLGTPARPGAHPPKQFDAEYTAPEPGDTPWGA
ncbi:hypothetical protein Q7C18_02610 [Nesterenkonia sp. CL21]|uniref:hypothetical protein n=1 Tax=Nesterenkonia sp. CL21 TaxID=3064894 RepID=UPI002878A05B|nr:hypothetical protein [Nesterenkonia sp. CL21]MDS2171580.1 hypothetical protein [Nesterenkonia sp. CL21]